MAKLQKKDNTQSKCLWRILLSSSPRLALQYSNG